jgi:3-phosphoshikimate 1-carboxyvinyltransferase
LNKVSLKSSNLAIDATIKLVSSKSESNRALIINALQGFQCELRNLSAARDTQTMKVLLNSGDYEANVIDAGTTMRFLTAYFAITGQHRKLTGTPRMCERPIGILVDALRKLGAKIQYEKNEGYPPLLIEGFEYNHTHSIEIDGSVSSQFVSAIVMVAPMLPNGLTIKLLGEVGSKPYIEMTLSQMRVFGAKVESNWTENTIKVYPEKYKSAEFQVESDWSGASYWYAVVALAQEAKITLLGLKENSLQGDSAIVQIMQQLGVQSEFTAEGVVLSKIHTASSLEVDFSNCPDLAQTVAVVCAAKGVKAVFTGIESLKVKETDRVLAIQNELQKFGGNLLELEKNQKYQIQPIPNTAQQAVVEVDTYDDHRMAMAFSPMAMVQPVIINHPAVVAKSYPSFWDDFRKVAAVKEL